jgi:hypothetical protein
MTMLSADEPGAHKPLVRQKWRPSLAMIVCAVLTTVMALPLAGLFFFRLYENQLIRQTEAELTAQCAVLAALFEREMSDATATPTADGRRRGSAKRTPLHTNHARPRSRRQQDSGAAPRRPPAGPSA